MVHTMRVSFRDLEPALERLLVAICRVNSPGKHLKRGARSRKSRA